MPNHVRVEQALLLNQSVILDRCDTTYLQDRLAANCDLALYKLPKWYENNFKNQAQLLAKKLLP
jgi:hypothetical protein